MASAMVEAGLAACANILPGMTSVYRWEGAVQEESETVLILKTRADAFEALSSALRERHPYECPCLVALPIERGSPDYLDWIRRSVTLEEKK